MEPDLQDLFVRLVSLGGARNRSVDKEPRTITITDDEALLLMNYITSLSMYAIDEERLL